MKARRDGVTAAQLRDLISYDPATGKLAWLAARKYLNGGIGVRADFIYVQVHINGRTYKAHRLAWLYMTGEWPAGVIDHINHNPSDNRFCN